MSKSNYWKRMSSGKYIDMGAFKVEDVDINDINTSLNHIVRFDGHYKDHPPLTVAQHSLLCYNLAQMYEPDQYLLHQAILIHDFAEAYIGDVSTPVKKVMGDLWHSFAGPIEEAVEVAFLGHCMGPEMYSRVKLYDTASLDIERRVMWESQYGKDKWPASVLNTGTLETKREMFLGLPKYVDLAELWEENH